MNIKTVLLVVAAVAMSVHAEESESAQEAAPAAKAPSRTAFSTLPLCRLKEGAVQVRIPAGEWSEAEEGKFYPLGSSFRTGADGRLVLAFSADSTAVLSPNSEIGTRAQALGVPARTVVLAHGTVNLELADSLPEGAFFVTAPGFIVKNPAGKSRYVYEDKGDGDRVTVRCVTGALAVEGRHFAIPTMHPADEAVIRTSRDQLFTFIYGTSGDYVVRLDQGVRTKDEVGDDGALKQTAEKSTAEWRLSPKMKIVINRMVPAIGERMSVCTMVFDAAGELQGSGVSFSEGRAEVNFGEIGVKEKVSGDELAKRAAEATETTEAADEDSSSGSGEKSEGEASENNEENN